MRNDQLLAQISAYCRQAGMAESTFGRRAVNDGKLVHRLREGKRITTDTLVVDVSPKNDWSQVRVAYSGTTLGRVSPTFGFIYPAKRS